jgi:hypothetical protein
METEFGEEQFCGSCCEFWSMDSEFFSVPERSVSYECSVWLIDRKLVRSGSLKRRTETSSLAKLVSGNGAARRLFKRAQNRWKRALRALGPFAYLATSTDWRRNARVTQVESFCINQTVRL